jgi:hypothetical protein
MILYIMPPLASNLSVGDEDEDESDIIHDRRILVPGPHGHVQQVVGGLLDLPPLVEGHQSPDDLLVLEELEDTVGTDHDHAVLLAQRELCLKRDVPLI